MVRRALDRLLLDDDVDDLRAATCSSPASALSTALRAAVDAPASGACAPSSCSRRYGGAGALGSSSNDGGLVEPALDQPEAASAWSHRSRRRS